MHVMTVDEFEALTPEEKGFAVYMCGCRKDQPNIPKNYDPAPEDEETFNRGQHRAVILAQDCP